MGGRRAGDATPKVTKGQTDLLQNSTKKSQKESHTPTRPHNSQPPKPRKGPEAPSPFTAVKGSLTTDVPPLKISYRCEKSN